MLFSGWKVPTEPSFSHIHLVKSRTPGSCFLSQRPILKADMISKAHAVAIENLLLRVSCVTSQLFEEKHQDLRLVTWHQEKKPAGAICMRTGEEKRSV